MIRPAARVVAALQGNSAVRVLGLCNFSSLDLDWAPLATLLRTKGCALEQLYLSSDEAVPDASLLQLLDAIASYGDFKSLAMDLPLSARQARKLSEAVRQNTGLAKLALWNESKLPAAVTKALLAVHPALTQLQVRYAGDSYGIAVAVSQMLGSQTLLSSLELDGSELGPKSLRALAKGLRGNQTLRELNLGGAHMGDSGIRILVPALATTRVQQLSLRGNDLGDRAAKDLAKLLENNTSLRELCCMDNSIGDKGATALAAALRKNATLSTLNLRWNSIGDEGIAAFGQMLPFNRSLRVLNLIRAAVEDAGAIAVAQGLEANSTLVELSLSKGRNSIDTVLQRVLLEFPELEPMGFDCQGLKTLYNIGLPFLDTLVQRLPNSSVNSTIGPSTAQAFARMLSRNTTLAKLCLADFDIDDKFFEILVSGLKSNSTLQHLHTSSFGFCNCRMPAEKPHRKELATMLLANQVDYSTKGKKKERKKGRRKKERRKKGRRRRKESKTWETKEKLREAKNKHQDQVSFHLFLILALVSSSFFPSSSSFLYE